MADYSMTDEAWNKRAVKVRTYLENNELGDMEAVIRWNLNQGDTDVDNRKRFWTSITTLFGMLPDSPITRGRESSLPEEVQQNINSIAVQYAEAFSAPFATDPLFGEIVRKHGKSDYAAYEDASDYGETLKTQMRNALSSYYRNAVKGQNGPQWDGTITDGMVSITVISSDDSSQEEEE